MVVGEHPDSPATPATHSLRERSGTRARMTSFSRMGGVEQHRAQTPWPFGAPLVAFGRPKITAEGQVPRERALVVVDGRSRNRS